MGFGEPDIATAPQAASANRLCVRSFDAGPGSIGLPELRRILLLASVLQGLVLLARLESDDARLTLGPGAAGPQRAWRTIPAGEPRLEHHAVLWVGVGQP